MFDTVNTFMDINELESFKLSDAVKFNKTLNPRLWGRDEHLLTEVREKLMAIADDFREFLGVNGLDVKDITVSGSNAAYTYTPHSDIDLHLVVDTPDDKNSDVYRELFDAKKYQYNDQHNYKIGGYDVELYVQDADKTHHSQGIYSLLNNDWVSVPRRRQPDVDDISVRSKFEDIGHRIEQAVASGDPSKMAAIAAKVKDMRQSGLDTTGEFGAENLAFKALRTQGLLDQLRTARNAVKDQELSLQERKKKKKQAQRGYGGYWYPGFSFGDGEGGGDGGGGESVRENTKSPDIKQILQPFIDSCVEYLGIEQAPKIILKRDPEWTRRNGTFGSFDSDTYSVTLAVSGRHVLDILRTLAHELTHARQHEQTEMPVDAGKTGSPYEDEANAMAGRIMRHWVDQYPEFFKDIPLEEDYDPNGPPPGPETKPTMPAGTVKVDVSDTYDWYKLGQHISNLKGLGQHDFGSGPPSTIMAFGSEKEEHKYIDALKKTGLTTTDIDPLDPNQPKSMPRQKTDPTYNVNESLDQPYKILRWEKGDYGDVDAIARLPDGTFLSVMFTKGFSQDTKEEAWSVEFFRNNSQEKTGEGDQQRVFATVLSAVQTFVSDRVPGAKGRYKPNKIFFSASKEVKPDEDQRKAMTRARLYDSLVQRYARALGFRAFRADTGKQVMYELSRIKPVVAEATGYIPVNDKEARDPRYSMAITQDIKPGEVQRQARKMGWTTDAAGRPPLLTSNASNLREFQDSNMKIAHILKEATLGGFPVKVLRIQDQGVEEAGNANSGRRGPNHYSPPDSSPVTLGRVEKTAGGVRHHADPSRYGGYDPKPEDDRLLGPQSRWRLDRAVRGLNEFAPPGNGGGDSGRWYTDDELADIIGDDWFEDFDVSNDGFNIDTHGEKAKQNLASYANSWFDDKGYNVNVMGVDHNDVDHDLKWYIVGSFHNPRFADKDVDEARNNYHANRTGFSRGARDPEGQDPQASQQVWGLKINGKVWSKQGKDVTFTSKQAAINTMNAILKNRPDLQGKIGVVTKGGVAEGLNEFAPGAGGDDGDADPYRYPKPTQFNRSVDYFGQFEADHFDREDFDDATGVFKGYWGNTQIAYFKFDNPAKTGSDDPGMGWYYEPESAGKSNSASSTSSVDNSEERKKQELNMIHAFLKSGQQPKPGSQIYQLMKRNGLAEDIGRRGFLKGMGAAAIAGAAGSAMGQAQRPMAGLPNVDKVDKQKMTITLDGQEYPLIILSPTDLRPRGGQQVHITCAELGQRCLGRYDALLAGGRVFVLPGTKPIERPKEVDEGWSQKYNKDKKDKKVSEGEGRFAGDTPVNIGGATVKRMAIGDTVTYFGRRAKIVDMTTDRKMSRITIANDMGGITKDVLTSDLKRTGVAEAIKLNAPQKSWSKQDMQDYLTRIKTGTKTKQDRFKPIIHGSNVKAITKDDGTEEWDLEDLKRQITTPPRAILGSNAKMSKSKKEGAITYDLTLPALSGIVVDEDTGEFVEITTCPGAGECQLFCYARKGGYVMFPAASMSAAQALNFLVNHPDEYMAMFDAEIKKTKALADKNGIKLLVRIHDAGDFFSKEYWDLSKKVQLNNPDVRFYFYSKMGDPVSDPNTPSNTLPNFSDGGAKSREVKKVELYRNAGKNLKGAPTIPKDMFRDLFVTDAKGKYVKDEQGRTQVKSPEAWENFKQKLSTKYKIDPGSIITYDQMNRIPEGPKPKWNVVVFPAGHGDLGATRLDVQNQFLMFH